MRKSVLISIMIVMLFSMVVGCSSTKSTSTDSGTPAAATADVTAAPTGAAKKPVTIKYMYWTNGPADKAAWNKIAELFHADNPNITLTVEALDPKAYGQVLKARLAGGEGPDIFGMQKGDYPAIAKAGYLTETTNEPWFKKQYPEAQKYIQLDDGKTYASELFSSGGGIIYNKDIFDKYALQEPKTFDELVAVSQKLKDNKVMPFAMSLKDSWWPQFILYYATAEHVNAKTPNFNAEVMQGKAKFAENAGWKESFEVFKTLLDKGFYAPNPLGVGFDQSKASFMQGEAAMMPATWELEDSRNAKINLGYFNFVTTNDPDSKYMWGSFGGLIGLNANNGHVAEENQFMTWLFELKNYNEMLKLTKTFPIMDGADTSGIDPLFPKMTESWKGKTMVGSPDETWLPGETQNVMITGFQELAAGKTTIMDILKRMDLAAAKAIKDKK